MRTALTLFCFMTERSLRMSSSDTQRPDTELNSWRFTPRKTIRCPLSFISPSFISNRRNPAFSAITSQSPPSRPYTSINRSYNAGSSALHRTGWRTFHSKQFSPASSSSLCTQICPRKDKVNLARPVPHVFVRISRLPWENDSSGTARTRRSRIWVSGTVYRYTSRKSPEKR